MHANAFGIHKKEGYLDNIDDILNTYLSFEEKALVFRNLALKCAVAGTNIEKIKIVSFLFCKI